MEIYDQYTIATYDDHKNPIAEENFEVNDGVIEKTNGLKMLYTYGSNGEITETINQMYDYEASVYMNMEKIVASDFVFFASGVDYTQTKNGSLNIMVSDNQVRFEKEGMNGYAIYSVTGTLISKGKVENNHGEVSIGAFPSGLYIIKVTTGDGQRETAKFVKR